MEKRKFCGKDVFSLLFQVFRTSTSFYATTDEVFSKPKKNFCY